MIKQSSDVPKDTLVFGLSSMHSNSSAAAIEVESAASILMKIFKCYSWNEEVMVGMRGLRGLRLAERLGQRFLPRTKRHGESETRPFNWVRVS